MANPNPQSDSDSSYKDLEKTPLNGTQGGKNNFSKMPNPRDVKTPGNSGGPSKGGSGVPDMSELNQKPEDQDL